MLGFLITFFISVLFAPIVIVICKRLKFGQNILNYVSEHSAKQGTPTMGGIIFILPTIILSLFFCKSSYSIVFVGLSIFFGFGLIGFLDDFIKIKYKQNLGLRPYQKIIFQLALSIIAAIYIFRNNLIPNEVIVPFSNFKINFGWFIIPFIIIVFISTTNSVNLTDGLDGLASGTSIVFLIFIVLIENIYLKNLFSSANYEYIVQMQNLNNVCLCCCGALLAFLLFNCFPAKIFMGDTGSLSLGALISFVCCCNGLSFYILIIGFMFVLSSLSVILQVLHYKRTKNRIFLMAPFHHHLQHKGMHENKIVFIYIVITLLLGLICLLTIN